MLVLLLLINKEIDDTIFVLDDIERNFELNMTHVPRYTNQFHVISYKEKQIEQCCLDSKGKDVCGWLIIDKSTGGSTIEYFDKRGIGWHGCAIIYFLYEGKKKYKGNKFCTELISRDTLPPLVLLCYHNLPYDLKAIDSDCKF